MRKARALKPGDVIGVAAPAGPVDEPRLLQGTAELERLGFGVRVAAGVLERRGFTAGPIETRINQLHDLFGDPSVAAVACASAAPACSSCCRTSTATCSKRTRSCCSATATSRCLVKKAGAFFTFADTKLGQGRENAKDYLRQHPELAGQLEEKIRASKTVPSISLGEGAESFSTES